MPKTSHPDREADSEPELDISSLIDVSFLLLIFFLISTTLIKPERDLAMRLPAVDSPVQADPDPALEIAIATDGRVSAGGLELAGPSEPGEPSQLGALRDELVAVKHRADLVGEVPLISLTAASGCGTQRFIDVINALAFAKIDRIAMSDDLAAN